MFCQYFQKTLSALAAVLGGEAYIEPVEATPSMAWHFVDFYKQFAILGAVTNCGFLPLFRGAEAPAQYLEALWA